MSKSANEIAAVFVAVFAALALFLHTLGVVDIHSAWTITVTPVFVWGVATVFARLMRATQRGPCTSLIDEPRLWRFDIWIAAAVYIGCTLAFFHPLFAEFETAVLGPPSDQPGYLWTLWWGHDALLGRGDATLRFTDLFFFPEGTSLEYHVYSWYNLVLAIPLRAFLTLPAIYNLLQLHTFVIGGLGAFALCRYLTRDSATSLVAGFVYAFSPVHYGYALAHMNISSIQFLPFFVLYFIRAVRTSAARDTAVAAFFFLLNAACSWYHFIYALFFVAFAYVYLAWRRGEVVLPDVLRTTLIVVGAGILPLSPWIVFMVSTGSRDMDVMGNTGYDIFVADVTALIAPHTEHLLAEWPPLQRLNARFPLNGWFPAGSTAYLGWSCLALACVALNRVPAAASRFACGALAFLLLSMGAHLRVAGVLTPVVLPTRLLQALPFLDSLRAPNRGMLVVYLFLGILVAVGIGRVRDGLTPGWRQHAFVLGAAMVIFFDYFSVARQHTNVIPPAVYAAIPRDELRFGILDLPLTSTNIALYLAYQTDHGLPIAEGYAVGRVVESLVGRMRGMKQEQIKAELAGGSVRYVVIHLTPPERGDRADYWVKKMEQAGLNVVFEDADAVLFQVY
ncbi:MAG: hypothetical protein IH881_11630 [Myxococcales bacterium]|nr:hypothetical protein [Myxococcales bacterium]